MSDKFKFQFSLEVLNHLGRGLYRNFATVIAEAVSNAWDAEATRVDIIIDQKNKSMVIRDNGKGMNAFDFQNKFLKVGYTRREDPDNPSRRTVLGRKGIGKLALLSVADKIAITSRKKNCAVVSAAIDNSELDEKIKNEGEYILQNISSSLEAFRKSETGTCIEFEQIKPVMNQPDIIKIYMAVIFNFSLSFAGEKFDIYVDGEKITVSHLDRLNNATQLLWTLQCPENAFDGRFKELKKTFPFGEEFLSFQSQGKIYPIKGYIASVFTPSGLKIRGIEDFRAGVNMFSNGRLRQEDILRDIASSKIVQNYLYGEIHVDSLDDDDDIFTSNREGLIKDSQVYVDLLQKLKQIQSVVINSWDLYRAEIKKAAVAAEYKGMKPENSKAIEKLLATKEDEDWQDKFSKEFLPAVLPKRSDKMVLICHSREDKACADRVYNELISRGFLPKEIIYSSSENQESRLPINIDIFKYMREFFVQSWYPNPHVVFIVSADMESSWYASLEAGAAWIMKSQQNLFVKEQHAPQSPLRTKTLYVRFDEDGNFAKKIDADRILDAIAAKFDKK